MKICFLGNAASIHVNKWARFFAERGHEVHVISFREARIENVCVHHIKTHGLIMISPSAPLLGKFGYFLWLKKIRKMVRSLKPDLVHAHSAISYGLAGAFSDYHPLVLSVWGSDVIDSPRRSRIAKKILKYNLRRVDTITATSHMLADETAKYVTDGKQIHTVPFGVDMELFSAKPKSSESAPLTVGIVKALEHHYGIEYLIRAVKIVVDRGFRVKLLIVGAGSLLKKLEQIASYLGISSSVDFAGAVQNDKVPAYLHKMDICVLSSLTESFGVAAVEASSCGIPVIASRVGGLQEVIVDKETGFLIEPKNSDELAEKIILLINNPEMRNRFGKEGRKFVQANYEWEACGAKMEKIYEETLRNF